MIDTRFIGKSISGIPEDAFAEGVSQSGLYPILVLASPTTVPIPADENWRLVKENVSGHYGRIFCSAVRELPIRPELLAAVRGIADECFTREHMGYFERLSVAEKEAVHNDYLRTLSAFGLTCSETNLGMLTQALYPVDASPDNLRKLSTDIGALVGLYIDDFVLLIIGPVF
ncbi:hypothetical protein ACP1ES_004665 [Escherichia coli]|uniref:hypothetical protein n=1 Tax=Escherichia coli TaxID=562 RepID=UPI000BE53063|nr:hypothetical protein [Escherichia coli]EEC9486693.1 hypothetical protein [Escherichia coli]MCO1294186.1 hypothetical protein [Escherichia coli]